MGAKIWTDVAISNDGSKIFGCTENAGVFYSSNGGTTDTLISPVITFYGISLSGDESTLIASSSTNNKLYVWNGINASTANYTSEITLTGITRDWRTTACSNNATFMMAGDWNNVSGNGGIFMSYNSGSTWNKNTSTNSPFDKRIFYLNCTSDGYTIVAVSWGIPNASNTLDYLYLGKYI